jgi:uncharacterized protein (DUF983 family)
MLKKGSKLNSILTGSCPRCQEESMYKGKNPYNPSETIKLNEQCSHCGLHYTIEPSFFYGAMYVSYGLGVGIGVASFVITNLLLGYGLKIAFLSIGVALVILMPIIMRLSRNIWINIFVSYDKDWKDNV